MGKKMQLLSNQRGSTMVVTLMIMVVLTIISFSLSHTAQTEIQIAANDLFYKMAFHNADTGVSVTSRLIEAFFDENFDGTALPAGFTYVPNENDFREEVLGLFDGAASPGDREVEFVADGTHAVEAELGFLERRHTVGSEVNTSLSFLYDMESQGDGPRGSVSNIEVVYRQVVKI